MNNTATAPSNTVIALIEGLRASLVNQINASCDAVIARIEAEPKAIPTKVTYKLPTTEDGHDPRNKTGVNLTERGAEIIYRLFDDGAGYNRAAKTLNISQGAAKSRKAAWTKLGGQDRPKRILDIDAE